MISIIPTQAERDAVLDREVAVVLDAYVAGGSVLSDWLPKHEGAHAAARSAIATLDKYRKSYRQAA